MTAGRSSSGGSVVVIFEVMMREGKTDDYFDLAAALRSELEKVDGFISVERFQSLSSPGKYLSLSEWRDEEAVRAWRDHGEHLVAQEKGKASIFADFRIRVTYVARDYTLADRSTKVENG